MTQHSVDSTSELYALLESAFEGAYKLSKAGLLSDSDAAHVMERMLEAMERMVEAKTPTQTGAIARGVGC